MNLIDGDSVNVFKSKRNDLIKSVAKVLKQYPVVPLYGDMKIAIVFILQQCKHWDADEMSKEWVSANTDKLRRRYEIVFFRQRIQDVSRGSPRLACASLDRCSRVARRSTTSTWQR
jgi:hypothetical protein